MKNMMNIKTPSNIYLWWNVGSSIMMLMTIQISTGIMISMNYINKNNMFDSSVNMYMNINYGWLMRLMHSNTTSILFIMMFMHMSRGMMFKSFLTMKKMWMSGMTMMIVMMAESFIGYSLIWNQMSYWAMMVITNFISTIPKLGNKLIKMVWGNFNINIILINRFLTLHFIIPMIMMVMSMIHLMILHKNKSNNPMGLMNKTDLVKLSPIFIIKDMIFLMTIIIILMNINLTKPFLFSNSDNFIMMNYFKTPSHIEPEWYFLFFYSILRSINNKLSGMLILMLSMVMMFLTPSFNKNKFQTFNPLYKSIIVSMMTVMVMMSILSTKPVEFPYKSINTMMMTYYFYSFFLMSIINKMWNKLT